MGRQLSFFVSSLIALLSLAGAPVRATSFVMVADEALADQAAMIVEARLLGRGPAAASGMPVTDYLFAVERVVKGRADEAVVAVRVPGGVRADGRGLKVWGAPAFADGGRALLFLTGEREGARRVLHLSLGAFHLREVDGQMMALRDLSQLQEVRPLPDGPAVAPARADRPRDLARFARWVEERAAGGRRPADYFVDLPAAALQRITAPFKLLECPFIPEAPECQGLNMRWFEFDTGGSVAWRAHVNGLAGIVGGGFAQFQTGLNAWNADGATPISYTYGGTTTSNIGFSDFDDINAVIFNDFQGDIVDGDFDCEEGGVIALGGPWFNENDRGTFNGTTYLPIAGADIIINDNTQCFFQDNPKVAEEVLAHELGHTLGLGHSCSSTSSCNASATLNNALMRWNVHDDNRGAALQNDDRAGIAKLYQPAATTPAAPSNLQAIAVSSSQVNLTWQDNSNNETSFRIEAQPPAGIGIPAFVEVGSTGPNATSFSVTGLQTGAPYVFRVRARNASGDSPYSNSALATTFLAPFVCIEGPATLCLNDGRFQVDMVWATAGQEGDGQGVELTDETGYFYFFSPQNVEVVVKVIDACVLATPRFWVFAGGLTDVSAILRVVDSQTGVVKTYENPQGTPFQPIQDTSAFATCP
jgi:fibronectin type III domain protein/matrixin